MPALSRPRLFQFASASASPAPADRCAPCLPLDCFHQHRPAQAAADADGGHAALLAGAFQRLQEMQHDARARGAYRMAQGDRPAVDIEFLFIQRTKGTVEAELLAA